MKRKIVRREELADSYSGIDRSEGKLLVEAWKIANGPLTPEMLEEAAALMLAQRPRPPCGSMKNPHLIPPSGGYCVNCGDGPHVVGGGGDG